MPEITLGPGAPGYIEEPVADAAQEAPVEVEEPAEVAEPAEHEDS